MRKPVLIIVVLSLFAAMVGLRVHSQLSRPVIQPPGVPASGPAVALPAVPPDYTVNPPVVAAEATAGPRRIISLAPSITEIVCALGLGDRLVGRTEYCMHPPVIQRVTPVGALLDTNYARIKALRPDLVLVTQNSGQVIDNLGKLGLRCEPIRHETLDEVYSAIRQVGAVCNRPATAAALASSIRADVARVQVQVGEHQPVPRRALVVLGALPVPPRAVFVAGPGLFADSLVSMAGHRNAAAEVLTGSTGELPVEVIRRLNPEVILEFADKPDPTRIAQMYQTWSAVGHIEAIDRRQVITVGGLEWLSAGPRIAIALHRTMAALSQVR